MRLFNRWIALTCAICTLVAILAPWPVAQLAGLYAPVLVVALWDWRGLATMRGLFARWWSRVAPLVRLASWCMLWLVFAPFAPPLYILLALVTYRRDQLELRATWLERQMASF